MRKISLALLLWVLVFAIGCVAGRHTEADASMEPEADAFMEPEADASTEPMIGLQSDLQILAPVLEWSCEVSTSCATGDYCYDGVCEARPDEYDDEPGYPGLDTHRGVCRVEMHDAHNQFDSTLQVEQINDVLFVVTVGIGAPSQWSVEAVLYEDGEMAIDAGVPEVDYDELLDEYELTDMGQLTFVQPDAYECSDFERALTYFLIMEWFFYG